MPKLDNVIELDTERSFIAALIFCRAGIPFFVWGPPGIGKSKAILRRVARYFGAQYNDVRLLLREPTEIRVTFNIDDKGNAKLSRAWWIPDGKVPTVIGFDEFNAAPRTTQAAAYEPLLDHAIDGHALPDNCYIGAAGNRESDRAVVEKMPTPARLRMAHINMVTSPDGWAKWAAGSDKEQEQVEDFPLRKKAHLIRAEVQAFNRFTGGRYLDELGNADDQKRQALFNAQTFSSARGMEFLSKTMDALDEQETGVDAMVEQACYAATVGLPVASEFKPFLKVFRSLPDIDEIIAKPERASVPKQDSVGTLYALSAALSRRMTKDNIGNILKYLDRLPSVEFNVWCVRDALRREIALSETRPYAQWVVRHADVGGW